MPSLTMLGLLARATVQRMWRRRERGVTAYYVAGFPGRLAAAEWQLARTTGTVLEVGCGRDLHLSLVAALRHGRRAIAWDVAPLADLDLVNYTAVRLGHAGGFTTLADLERIGVRYVVAPDIAGLAGYDGVVSAAVLEHLPADRIAALFDQAARAGAQAVAADIDLADHWSYLADVGPDHFYYLSEPLWAYLNTGRMWQNRLRFPDLDRLAGAHGFALAEAERTPMPAPVDLARLNRRFRAYAPADLAVRRVLACWRRR